ncbi:MAG: FKBP-type peptidyl-prolyl cis-trans isomerase [Verrucomicrobiota bacterium]
MKSSLLSICAITAVSAAFFMSNTTNAQDESAAEGKPESLTDRISYAYGILISQQLKDKGLDINLDQFNAAFKTVVAGEDSLMTEADMDDTFSEIEKIVAEKNRIAAEANAEGKSKENLEAGRKYLEENAKKEGVKVTDSGLQYEVLEAAEGATPEASDTVEVHYHGILIDGTVFDSSVERGKTTTFPLAQVIPGWTEGVALMPVGSKYKFTIPYHLAYGTRGAGADIGPFSCLIFEVELVSIK